MKNNLIGCTAVTGLAALLLIGMSQAPVHADDDYRYIPNDHRPLTFWNDDGSLHYRSSSRSRLTQRRRSSEPFSQSSGRAPSIGRSGERSADEKRAIAERAGENVALICPVTGDKIASVQDAVGQSTFKGKTYYFCCAGCKPRFDKDPAKFVKNATVGKFEKM